MNDTTKTDCGGGCGGVAPDEACPKCGKKKSECSGGGKCGACRQPNDDPGYKPERGCDNPDGPCACGAWHKRKDEK